jgi:hypothetical protein
MCERVTVSFDIFHRQRENHNYIRDGRNFSNRTEEDWKAYHLIPRFRIGVGRQYFVNGQDIGIEENSMSRNEFEEFLRRQEEEITAPERVDWNKTREEWVKHIEDFYKMVKDWMKDYVKSGKVTIKTLAMTLNEQPLGAYKTHKLVLKIANQEVILSPIGTLLIGAKGRIDMESRTGKVRFVLVDERSEGSLVRTQVSGDKRSKSKEMDESKISWTWKIAVPPPSVNYIPLNEESFFDALMELINV